MNTILYLVRHGETVDNARQLMQGQTQGELNENGVLQAKALSEQWRNRVIDAVISSDLKRAVDTGVIRKPSFPGWRVHHLCQTDISWKEGAGRWSWHHQ